MKKRLNELEQMIKIQCQNGTWNFNSYQFGLATGLLLAYSVMMGQEPEFMEAPDEWLEDDDRIKPEQMKTAYETIRGKWWEFVNGAQVRPLTDLEAASVVWG